VVETKKEAVDDGKTKKRVLLMKIEDLIFILFKINFHKIKNQLNIKMFD